MTRYQRYPYTADWLVGGRSHDLSAILASMQSQLAYAAADQHEVVVAVSSLPLLDGQPSLLRHVCKASREEEGFTEKPPPAPPSIATLAYNQTFGFLQQYESTD